MKSCIAHFNSLVYWRYPPAGNGTSNSWHPVPAATEHSSILISRSICSSGANFSYVAMGVVSVSSAFSSLEPPVFEVPAWLQRSAFILEKRKHIKRKLDISVDRGKSEVVIDIFVSCKDPDKHAIHAKLWRRRKFPFRKRSLPFLGQLENFWPVIESVSIKKKTGPRTRTFRILISLELPYH